MSNEKINKTLTKIIFDLFVIICGLIGVYFTIVGLLNIPNQKLLFSIGLLGSITGILVAIFELYKGKEEFYNSYIGLILLIFSGIVVILACLFVFFTTHSLIMKGFSLFGIVFFSIGTIKAVFRVYRTMRK